MAKKIKRPKTLKKHMRALQELYPHVRYPKPNTYSCFYGPGGIARDIDPRDRDRVYRALEVEEYVLDALPWIINHHAGSAWRDFCAWVYSGGTDFIPGHDSYRKVADSFIRLPEILRRRLDAVFVGLGREADPDGYYAQRFAEIERNWYSSMDAAYLLTQGDPQKRLRRCKQLGLEAVPDFIGFFEELREHVCGGGAFGWWSAGDDMRQRWDFGYFGEKFSLWGKDVA